MSFFEDFNEKKDKVINDIKAAKDEYENKRKAEKEQDIYKREEALRKKELIFTEREKSLKSRERSSKRTIFVNSAKYTILISTIVSALNYAYYNNQRYADKVVSEMFTATSNFFKNEEVVKSSVRSGRELDLDDVYRTADPENKDFDVGSYCLHVEKKGNISLEECLARAASKIRGN